MSRHHEDLTRANIKRLITNPDAELARRGHRAMIFVVGGANIAIAVDGSRATTDIHVVVKRGSEVLGGAARAVARGEHGIGRNWLNGVITGLTTDDGLTRPWRRTWTTLPRSPPSKAPRRSSKAPPPN